MNVALEMPNCWAVCRSEALFARRNCTSSHTSAAAGRPSCHAACFAPSLAALPFYIGDLRLKGGDDLAAAASDCTKLTHLYDNANIGEPPLNPLNI